MPAGLAPTAKSTRRRWCKAGVLRRAKDGVRLLGGGEIKAKVALSVFGASKSAVAAVEKARRHGRNSRSQAGNGRTGGLIAI